MVDEIKAKITVPELIKATVSPNQLTGKVESAVMLDPDVNLIKVAGQAIGADHPVPARLSDGSGFIDPREIENPPNLDAKLSDIEAALDNVFGQLDSKTSTLAKESDGNLEAIKTKTDNIPASPSQEHAAANSPHAARLSDGSEFIDPRQVSIQELDALLRYMLQTGLLQTTVDAAGRLRIVIDVAGTATPVTISSGTVSTLSAITTFPYGQAMDLDQMMYLAYQNAQRDKMTFS